MSLFERFSRRDPPPPQPVNREAKRFEMSQTDPDFAHVRDVYHDARTALAGQRAASQIRDRFSEGLRESWRRPS